MPVSYEDLRREAIRRGLIAPTSHVDAFLRSAGDGVTLGFGDEIQGELAAFGRTGEDAQRRREEATNAARQRLYEARADRPVTSFAGGVASAFVPGTGAFKLARLGGAGLRGALYGSSALTGAAYGAGSGETPGQRVSGAVVGGMAGLGGAAAGEAVGYGASILRRQGLDPRARALRLLNRSVRDSAPTEQDVMRRLVRDGVPVSTARARARQMVEDGSAGTYTPQDMVNRASHLQGQGGAVEEMAMEMAPGFRNDARALSAVRGPGQGVVQRALNQRREGMTQRVLAQADEAFRPQQTRSPGRRRGRTGQTSIDNQPPPSGFQEFRERLDVARRGQNRDAYDAAYRQDLSPEQQATAARRMSGGSFKEQARRSAIERADEDIARLSDDLDNLQASGVSGAQLERTAWELADVERARTALMSLGTEAPEIAALNARALDLYQRGLRHLSDSAGGAATEGGRNVAAVRGTFMSNLRSVSPALHQAIGTARGFRDVDEALVLGRGIFQRSNEAEVDQLLRGVMAREEMDAFMVGVMEAVENKIGEGGGAAVMRLMRNQNWLNLLERSAGSKAAARRLRQRIERSALERETENFVQGGSQTTPISQDIARLTNEDELGFLGDLTQATTSGGLLPFGIRHAVNAYKRVAQPGINNPEVARNMAQMLTTRATVPRIKALAAEIEAAPRSPIFTPQAQRTAALTGIVGGQAGAQSAANNPLVAELGGGPALMRAGEAVGSGDYKTAAVEGTIGGMAALPFLGRAAGPLTRMAAGALGLTAVGSGVAQAQDRREAQRQEFQTWAQQQGFERYGDYVVVPPTMQNDAIEVETRRPSWRSLRMVEAVGNYLVMERASDVRGRGGDRYLYEVIPDEQGGEDSTIYRGAVYADLREIGQGRESEEAPREHPISGWGLPAAIAGNVLTRGALGRASPWLREFGAAGGGIIGGAAGEGATGGDPIAGGYLGAGASLTAAGGARALQQFQRGPRALARPPTPSPNGRVIAPDPARVQQGQAIQRRLEGLNGGRPLSPRGENASLPAQPQPVRPRPQRGRRAFETLAPASQMSRVGSAAEVRRIAERELGRAFRTGREAITALRARMANDPAFRAKMNQMYPALAGLVVGGAVGAELVQD